MKARLCGLLLIAVITICVFPLATFEKDLDVKDISKKDWYYNEIQKACSSGLIEGFENDTFRPEERITYAEVVKIACSIKQSYTVDHFIAEEDARHWYDAYIDYAREHDIIFKEYPWNDPITRGDFAEILSNTLMESSIPPINTIDDGMIPDVPMDYEQASSIYQLYRAGILTGVDPEGRFYPETTVKRCEMAVVLTRIIDETVRIDMTMLFDREPQESTFRVSDIREGVKIPVLMYHGVSNRVWGLDYLFVSPNNMRQQLEWLQNNGYETIFFSDLSHLSDFRRPILLTFDDGYEGNYTDLFPVLKELHMKATVFVVSDEIGTDNHMNKFQLREMSDSGLVSIQSHTKSHVCLDTLDREQLHKECQESKMTIGKITGKFPYAISYPEGRHNTLSDSIVSKYYSFGILDRNGPWITNRKSRYQITRTVIPREFNLEQFAAFVKK